MALDILTARLQQLDRVHAGAGSRASLQAKGTGKATRSPLQLQGTAPAARQKVTALWPSEIPRHRYSGSGQRETPDHRYSFRASFQVKGRKRRLICLQKFQGTATADRVKVTAEFPALVSGLRSSTQAERDG